MTAVRASQIAAFLGTPLAGADLEVHGPRPLSRPDAGALLFATRFAPETAERLNAAAGTLVIAHEAFRGRLAGTHLLSSNPRRDFARVATEFFGPRRTGPDIAPTAVVAPGARLGQGVRLGHHVVVAEGVEIGDNTEIRDGAVLRAGTRIGRDCLVKSNSVIGDEGFGFDFAEDGTPIRVPHYGGVQIGDRVEIGALCTVVRGTLEDTVVGDDVKMDDHVHIAHNCVIGARTIITACAEVSGSVVLGADVWLGPQSSVNNKVTVGDRAMLGLGAVANKDVPGGMIVVGNPARVLRPR